MWYVYILQCADQTLYTGVTIDVQRRLEEHNTSELGAKYTRSRRPVKLIYTSEHNSKAQAAKEEYRIKKLTRTEKLKLIGKLRHST